MAWFWLQAHFLGTGKRGPVTAFSTYLLKSGVSGCSCSSPHPHQVHPDISPEDLNSMVLCWAPLPSLSVPHFLCTARGYLFLIFCLHLQLPPDMAENASVTDVFREILALQVQKVQPAGWRWSGKQHSFFMQDCMTERRPWAQRAAALRAGVSTRHRGWVKVVLPWSQRPVHKEKMLCPTPAWFAQVQLQVPSLLHAPTWHPPQEGLQEGKAERRRSRCLQPHTAGECGSPSQHTSTLPRSSPI